MSWAPKNIPLTPSLVKPVLKKSLKSQDIFEDFSKTHINEAPLTLPILPNSISSKSKIRCVKTQTKTTRSKTASSKNELTEEFENNFENHFEDPLMLDCPMLVYWSKKIDQEKVDNLAENIKDCTSKIETTYKSCFQASGRVSGKDWERALEIYENNQDFFYQKFIQNKIKEEKYSFHLNQLEMWFCGIIEPKKFTDKKLKQIFEDGNRDERERFKITHGRSFFCRKEIIPVILPFPDELINFIIDFF